MVLVLRRACLFGFADLGNENSNVQNNSSRYKRSTAKQGKPLHGKEARMRTWQDVRVPGARIGRLSSKWIKFASVKQPWSTHKVRFIQDLTVQENGSHSFTGRMHIRAFSRNRAESFSSWRALCSSPSTSQIHATAQIHPSATVGAFSVISERVQVLDPSTSTSTSIHQHQSFHFCAEMSQCFPHSICSHLQPLRRKSSLLNLFPRCRLDRGQ